MSYKLSDRSKIAVSFLNVCSDWNMQDGPQTVLNGSKPLRSFILDGTAEIFKIKLGMYMKGSNWGDVEQEAAGAAVDVIKNGAGQAMDASSTDEQNR